MHFELLDFLSLPGDPHKPNEDSFVFSAAMAAVFDGATGLGEPLLARESDAQWIAQWGARRLRVHAETGEGSARDWLRLAAADAKNSFLSLRRRAPRENYEVPLASVIMVVLHGEALEALWLGDCAAFVRTPDGKITVLGDIQSKRESERQRAVRLAKVRGAAPAGDELREEFMPALRATRNRVNSDGGEWLFAPDPAVADHAVEARTAAVPDALLLVASDGFLALVTDYERYTAEALIAAAKTSALGALGEELRAIEAADPSGVRYPRFKRSDDATALLLAVRA